MSDYSITLETSGDRAIKFTSPIPQNMLRNMSDKQLRKTLRDFAKTAAGMKDVSYTGKGGKPMSTKNVVQKLFRQMYKDVTGVSSRTTSSEYTKRAQKTAAKAGREYKQRKKRPFTPSEQERVRKGAVWGKASEKVRYRSDVDEALRDIEKEVRKKARQIVKLRKEWEKSDNKNDPKYAILYKDKAYQVMGEESLYKYLLGKAEEELYEDDSGALMGEFDKIKSLAYDVSNAQAAGDIEAELQAITRFDEYVLSLKQLILSGV